MRVPWDYDAMEGVGPSEQTYCSIPHCKYPVECRGLCNTCFQAWYRNGMLGLERRMKRLANNLPFSRVPVDNLDKAMEMLTDAYERMIESVEDNEKYDAARAALIKVCVAIGTTEKRKKQRQFRNQWREDYIRQHGLEAFRKWQNTNQSAYRKRKETKGYIRIQRDNRAFWVKKESVVEGYWRGKLIRLQREEIPNYPGFTPKSVEVAA